MTTKGKKLWFLIWLAVKVVDIDTRIHFRIQDGFEFVLGLEILLSVQKRWSSELTESIAGHLKVQKFVQFAPLFTFRGRRGLVVKVISAAACSANNLVIY